MVKSLIFDFSLALVFLVFCLILAIFGLSVCFDFYVLSAGFYDHLAYTQTFFGWALLTLSVIFLVFHLIYFGKFFKSLFEIYKNKTIFASQLLWFCGALLPIFGGVFIFMASLFEIVFFKFLTKKAKN